MDKALLILDLDNTLIFGCEVPLARSSDFKCGPYFIYKRPGVHEFLDAVRTIFNISIWSSASEDYVRCVVDQVFGAMYPVSFVWSRDRCTRRMDPRIGEITYIKDLKKVRRRGYKLERILMIDDDARALSRNYGNLIRVAPYSGDVSDTELSALIPYLHSLSQTEDVRKADKRAWKSYTRDPESG
jgi:RNA polymerase II subunit A small phosphatase-like protein